MDKIAMYKEEIYKKASGYMSSLSEKERRKYLRDMVFSDPALKGYSENKKIRRDAKISGVLGGTIGLAAGTEATRPRRFGTKATLAANAIGAIGGYYAANKGYKRLRKKDLERTNHINKNMISESLNNRLYVNEINHNLKSKGHDVKVNPVHNIPKRYL